MCLDSILMELISLKKEGEYWDFKKCWHDNTADLVKDIICLANNTTVDKKDGYLIFGIEDSLYNIVGIKNDNKRKNEENLIGILAELRWGGENIPLVKVKTIIIKDCEIDIVIVKNESCTPYYLLEDYTKPIPHKDSCKTVVRAGVVYSRCGDRNTNSNKCATKAALEFLWKKRFGLVGTDEEKVIKRLQNVEAWYYDEEDDVFCNFEYGDIMLKKYSERNEEFGNSLPELSTMVMDFPYLFTHMINWNLCSTNESVTITEWKISINNRKLEKSIFSVQASKSEYPHVQPQTFRLENDVLANKLNKVITTVPYKAYIANSIEYFACYLYYKKFSYHDYCTDYNGAFKIIPVFINEVEHQHFITYLGNNKKKFDNEVIMASVEEVCPEYAVNANSIIVYKLGKVMVRWLKEWRAENKVVFNTIFDK